MTTNSTKDYKVISNAAEDPNAPRPVTGEKAVLLKNGFAKVRAMETEVARQRLAFLDLQYKYEGEKAAYEKREFDLTQAIGATRAEVNQLAQEAAESVHIQVDGEDRWILDQNSLTFVRG